MLVSSRNGELRQKPFAESNEQRVATEVVHHCDEEEMLQNEFGPEMRFPFDMNQFPCFFRSAPFILGDTPFSMQWKDSPNAISPRMSNATI